ncbi:MAG TPA: hypothetical protein DDZ51_07030 [Planctomycetaceae bacterium]|nr:hypothetical protein [Planctomycetaceae bacterium]
MAKLAKKQWELHGWERGKQLKDKEGNQGHAFLARKVTDPDDEYNYILKTLKRQTEPARRAMFLNEISAMATLEHPGVLQVEITNAQDYKGEVELYLITRLLQGPDLEDLVERGLPFQEAIEMTLGVLDILNHCHQRGVIHRDIKPCHVFVEDRKFDSPYLIDFGLAYNEEHQLSDAATATDQGKGNRFLIGPEHLPGANLANRNAVTDVTQCAGLLFFALTKRNPGVLRDADEKKPHQRHGDCFDASIPGWKRDLINRVFDKAFEWHPDRRWVSARSLADRLQALLEDKESDENRLRSRAANVLKNLQIEERTNCVTIFADMSKRLFETVDVVLKSIVEEMGQYLTVKCQHPFNHESRCGLRGGGFGVSETGQTQYRALISMTAKQVSTTASEATTMNPSYRRSIAVTLHTQIESDHVFVALSRPYTGSSSIYTNNQPKEVGRCGIGDLEGVHDMRSGLEEDFLTLTREVLE